MIATSTPHHPTAHRTAQGPESSRHTASCRLRQTGWAGSCMLNLKPYAQRESYGSHRTCQHERNRQHMKMPTPRRHEPGFAARGSSAEIADLRAWSFRCIRKLKSCRLLEAFNAEPSAELGGNFDTIHAKCLKREEELQTQRRDALSNRPTVNLTALTCEVFTLPLCACLFPALMPILTTVLH